VSRNSEFVISPKNGLCNKLRVVFSYLQIAREANKKLIVLWNDKDDKSRDIGGACPGFFLDYFEPIKDVEFIESNRGYEDSDIDYKGCWYHESCNPQKVFIYQELRLLPYLRKKVEENIKYLDNNYIAVHVRRTDFMISVAQHFNVYMKDEEYFNFIDKHLKSRFLYIATDNLQTQELFYEKYSNHIKVINLITNRPNLKRQTSLEDAIVDLYMCINSEEFLGTKESTFSWFIDQHRGERKRLLDT